MKRERWSDKSLLKSIPNPNGAHYEIKIEAPELTFLGIPNQPDFAKIDLTMYPGIKVIELKSLKIYLHQFRNKVISYERLINVIFEDLIDVYKPVRLKITLLTNPRGGISSKLTIDSDCKSRGGKEAFKKISMNNICYNV
jgi:7-cyano-7-deazaguanine reductase